MNDIYEFLFCPVHGVLAPKNWPTLMPVLAGLGLSTGLTVTVARKCKKWFKDTESSTAPFKGTESSTAPFKGSDSTVQKESNDV